MMNRETFATSSDVQSDGHTLKFLANSGKVMGDNGLTVDLDTLTVPLIDGSYKALNGLDSSDQIAVPLMTDHSWTIQDQAGVITSLEHSADGMEATAKLSDTPAGKLVAQLAAEGMLTNSFSISIDYQTAPGKDGVIKDSQLVEISVVYKGADERARYRSLNMKGTEMNKKTIDNKKIADTVKSFALSEDDASKLTDAVTGTLQDALNSIVTAINDDTENTDAADTSDDTPEPAQSSSKNGGTKLAHQVILNKANMAVNGHATFTHDRKTWLDSKQAVVEFEKNLLAHHDADPEDVGKAWHKIAAAKMGETASFGISGEDVDKLIPTEVITEIQDAYNTADPIWPLLDHTGLDQFTVGANSTDLKAADGVGRANGYPRAAYGSNKVEEQITLIKRQLTADYVYKYITLNKGDIRKTQRPGALVSYVVRELGARIFQTIGRSVLFDDWPDMAMFRSVLADAKDSSTESEWAGNKFALSSTVGEQANLLFDFKVLAAKVKAAGAKVLVTNSTTAASLGMVTNANGTPLLPLATDQVANVIGVSQIITPEWWDETEDATVAGIVFVPGQYKALGDNSVEAFTNFTLRTNTNEYLQELYSGGGLGAEKSAGVLWQAAES